MCRRPAKSSGPFDELCGCGPGPKRPPTLPSTSLPPPHSQDSNGWISRQEFEEFFTDMHLRMDPELLILLMDHYDTDHDGKIKYSELAEALS